MLKEQNQPEKPEEFAIFHFEKNVYKVNLADYLKECKKVIRLPGGEIMDPDKVFLERYNKHGDRYKIPRLLSMNGANPIIYQMCVVNAELFKEWDGSCRTIHS